MRQRQASSTRQQSQSLPRLVRRGAMWSGINTVILRLGTFAAGIIAARLIAPDEFGVFAIALTVHAVILNISEIGVSTYLVRHPGDPSDVAPTVTAVALISGSVLAFLMAAGAPEFAAMLGSPAAAEPIRVLAGTVVLAGVSAVPNALLIREFRQDRRFIAEASSFVAANTILVLLALAGGGAMALALSRLAGHVVSTALLLFLAPHRYRPSVDRAQLPVLLRFGLPLAGSTLLGFAISNLDYVVIGRMLGTRQLGLYFLAYNVSNWTFGVISPVLASIAVPTFARVGQNKEQYRDTVLLSVSTVSAIALPATAAISALAAPLVTVIYGSRWQGAAVALSVTAIYGGTRVAVDLLTNIGIAAGRTRALLICQIAYCAGLLPAMVLAVDTLGIVGAGIAHIVAITALWLPGLTILVKRASGVTVGQLLAAVRRPFVAAALAGVAAHLTARTIDGGWSSLMAGLIVGAMIYVALSGLWLLKIVRKARTTLGGNPNEAALRVETPRRQRRISPPRRPSRHHHRSRVW